MEGEKKNGEKEVEERLKRLEQLYEMLPEDMKEAISLLGRLVRVYVFGGKSILGVWMMPKIEVSWVEIATYEKVYDPNEQKYYYEKKTVRVPFKYIQGIEVIEERTPAEEVEAEEEKKKEREYLEF